MNDKKFNKWFNVFLLVGMTICLSIACIYNLHNNAVGTGLTTQPWFIVFTSIGALMGVLGVVYAANANILTFLFGLIDVVIYSFTLFDQGIYMNFALHVLYFVPMEFVGFYQWRKRGATSSKAGLKARRLQGKQWIWAVLGYMGVFGVIMLLRYSLDSGALAKLTGWEFLHSAVQEISIQDMALDSVMTSANIVALVLMALAFTDQWYLWLLVNVASVVTFAFKISAGGADAGYTVAQLFKYIFYLLNSINAIRIWLKLSKNQGPEPAVTKTCSN